MRTIIWSEKALADFDCQINHIALDSPKNATLVADRVDKAILALKDMPTGRFGRVAGTYEKLVVRTALIIAYQMDAEGNLAIVRIIHAARNWQTDQWPEE
jgi:toxin ParE1/3/4